MVVVGLGLRWREDGTLHKSFYYHQKLDHGFGDASEKKG